MSLKNIRILVFYILIILTMGFTYLVVQNRYSYERTHGTTPSTAPDNYIR